MVVQTRGLGRTVCELCHVAILQHRAVQYQLKCDRLTGVRNQLGS